MSFNLTVVLSERTDEKYAYRRKEVPLQLSATAPVTSLLEMVREKEAQLPARSYGLK